MQKVHRISAKALIVHDGRMLLIKKTDAGGDYYILPGGGQNHGENLFETLIREVKEETGYAIHPLDLVFVRDYIGANHEFAADSSHFHQVELYFAADLAPSGQVDASEPDSGQIGVEWVEVGKLTEHRVYPLRLREMMRDRKSSRVYLGDIN